MHNPPGNLKDFDQGHNPGDLYQKWHDRIADMVQTDPSQPAWYVSLTPPVAGSPTEAAPPWQGMPRMALVLNHQDVLAAATAVDQPVEYGSGTDALLVTQPDFLNAHRQPVKGFFYRPQDEYLEWVTKTDPDGVVREIWFTCEAPEYWTFIAEHDTDLLVSLYAQLMGVDKTAVDPTLLYMQEDLTHVEPFAGGHELSFPKGAYNPYNIYNRDHAIHLTQGANSLDAEITLARQGSWIWGNPPKTTAIDLICCAEYGEPNRFSDPTIGKEVNDLIRESSYVTLRNPIGLYIQSIAPDNFTDTNNHRIANFDDYFVKVRKSDDGTMIVRAVFRVPDGVKDAAGKQLRVGDLQYKGVKISKGGQVADAITMHLFAQALPGAPHQQPQPCAGHACTTPNHPGVIILTDINTPCHHAMNDFALTGGIADFANKLTKVAPVHKTPAFTGKPRYTRARVWN